MLAFLVRRCLDNVDGKAKHDAVWVARSRLYIALSRLHVHSLRKDFTNGFLLHDSWHIWFSHSWGIQFLFSHADASTLRAVADYTAQGEGLIAARSVEAKSFFNLDATSESIAGQSIF